MLKRITFFFLFLGTSLLSMAQWEIGFGMNGMGPVDRFQGSVYKNGVGMFTTLTTSSFLGKNNPNKVQLGCYFDYLYAGSKSFDVKLEDPVDGEGKTTFRNYMTGQHLFLRYGYEASSRVVIFTDLIIGHRRFFSETVTGLKNEDPEYADDTQIILARSTYRHGIGMGVRYGFGRSFGLEVRADYTRGDRAAYFDLNTVKETSTAITYKSESWAHTDLFVGCVALNWRLFKPTYTPSKSNSNNNPYSDNYNNSNNSVNSGPYRSRTSNPRTSTTKKTVKSSKTVEEEKEEKKKIDW